MLDSNLSLILLLHLMMDSKLLEFYFAVVFDDGF